ncbi:hypothetical protein KKC00_01100 [Patescibacteria group bacterium]|nr:hypothetical protein [Patescibacteria group bacterium]
MPKLKLIEDWINLVKEKEDYLMVHYICELKVMADKNLADFYIVELWDGLNL